MTKRGFIDHKTSEVDDDTQKLLKSRERWICSTRVSIWTYRSNIFWCIFYTILSLILLIGIRDNTILTLAGDGYTGYEAAKRYDIVMNFANYWDKWYMEIFKVFPLLLAWNYIKTALVQILFFKIVLTNSRIILVDGFVSKDVTDLKLDKIETMRVNQDMVGKFFDYGDLIFHGTGDTKITVGGIDKPYRFKKYVDHYQQEDYASRKRS